MAGVAWAQGGGAPAGPGAIVSLMPIALMFVILYFLLIRPQQRRAREHDTMIQNLKRNDEIVTSGGIHGRIQTLEEKVVTVEIAPNVRIRLDRSQVATVGRRSNEKEKDKA
jgi:preprotein translocase subunit YajC